MSHTHARATDAQVDNRRRLLELFEASPLPREELLVNLHLYTRSSMVAKLLWINELYELIVRVPGVIVELGVWWGANQVLFENLRAVHEPYNFTRRIVGFDTFEGYPKPVAKDGDNDDLTSDLYDIGQGYLDHLRELVDVHRRENVMGHMDDRHDLRPGDAGEQVERYLVDHPEALVSLAYFDMQMYAPTKRCLELLLPRMPRGAVLAMDELNAPEFPGETTAFLEVVGLTEHRLVRSRFLPDRSYVVIGG